MGALRTGGARRAAALATALTMAGAFLVVVAPPAAAANPVAMSISSSPNPVASGNELTYTIKVTNTGGSKVTEVVLTDVVNNLTGVDGTNQLVLSSDIGGCTQSGNTVTCDAPVIQGFQVWTVTIRGVVTAPNGTTLNNTASVTGTKSATTFTSSATVTTQVVAGAGGPLADLTVSIKAPTSIPPSGDLLYTVTVNNLGNVKASDVALTFTFPSTVSYVTHNATNLFTCSPPPPGSTTISCTGGAVNAGSNATIQIGAQAPATNNTAVTVTTAVDPFNTVAETNDQNNATQATTQVSNTHSPGTLYLEKTDGPDPIAPFEQLTYTLFLENTSGSRADYIEVVDGTQGLDAAGVTVTATVTGTAVPMTCSVAAPKVTCTTTRFQPGATSTIVIKGTVITPAGQTIVNTATVNGNIRNTGVTNTASTITTVRPARELTVTQHRTSPIAPTPVRAADRFDYLITVGNSGLYDAANVVVREPLPFGLDSLSTNDDVVFDTGTAGTGGAGFDASVPGTTCGLEPDNVVVCTIPTVKGMFSSGTVQGTTQTIKLFLIAPHTVGPITSTVTVDPTNAIPENDESNNTYTTTTNVLTGIDLTITKAHTPNPVARNGTLRYTITVKNEGTQDATDIVVRDSLPTGAVFRVVTDTPASTAPDAPVRHDFNCRHVSAVAGDPDHGEVVSSLVECTGGRIEGTYSGSLTELVDVAVIHLDVFAPDEPGIYHNEVRVDPDSAIAEKNDANNLAMLDTDVRNGLNDPAQGAYKELHWTAIVDSPDPVATNGTLDYLLTVTNTGSADAFNVTTAAKLPAGSRFRAANDTGLATGAFSCGYADGVVTCSNGTVTSAGSRTIKIETFAPNDPGTALLEAIVDPANAIGEADETNNQLDSTTTVQWKEGTGFGVYYDLKVGDITDSSDPVAPSGTLIYTIPITNTGNAAVPQVTFTAQLPTGSQFRSAEDLGPDAPAFSCTHEGGVVTCTTGQIDANASRQVKITLWAPETPDPYVLDVVVDPANAIPEGHEGNNSAVESTIVALGGGGGYIDLKLAVSDVQDNSEPTDGVVDDPVRPGALIQYKLDVTNEGTNDAFNVHVRNPLPANVTFLEAFADDVDSNFSCNYNSTTRVVDCTGGYVIGKNAAPTGPKPPRSITIRVTAPLAHNVTITDQASVDPANAIPEASEVNNLAQTTTKVESDIDLSVDMTDGSVSQDTSGTWKFTVTKTGAGIARDVTVQASYSAGVILTDEDVAAMAPAGWFCDLFENAINKVVCTGDMTVASLDFNTKVHRTDSGTLHSSAEIDPVTSPGYGNVVETDENNNRDEGQNS